MSERLPSVPFDSSSVSHAWPSRWCCTLTQLIRVACGICLWLFISKTFADPDLWGHLRFGLDLLATRAMPTHDAYSFTADQFWVNHEWLAELLMGIAYAGAGAMGLNLLKIAAIAIVAVVVAVVAKDEHATPAARDTLVGLTVALTYTRTHTIRPQMFSVALFCVVLYLLRRVDRGSVRSIWGVPLCFMLWVNLHGAWFVGLVVVTVWLIAAVAEGRGARTTVVLIAAAFATVAATLINPYGVGLWRFLTETVHPERTDIFDWKPLLELPLALVCFEALLPILALLSLLKVGGRVPLRYVAILLILIGGTFKVSRVDAFAQAAIAVLLAPQISAALQSFGSRLRAHFWVAPIPVAPIAVAAVTIAMIVGGWRLREITVHGGWIPDRDAAVYLRNHAPGARVLTWFTWGEYALWQLAPAGIRISIDGRRETVYSAEVITRHNAFYQAATNELDYPDRIAADQVWLPADLPAIAGLRHRGWNVAFESPRSVVLTRRPAEAYTIVHASDQQGSQTFPWP